MQEMEGLQESWSHPGHRGSGRAIRVEENKAPLAVWLGTPAHTQLLGSQLGHWLHSESFYFGRGKEPAGGFCEVLSTGAEGSAGDTFPGRCVQVQL